MQLYDREPQLQTPKVRGVSVESLPPSEYFELPRDLIEKVAEKIPLQELKTTVDAAEQELNERKKARGIQPTGCGGNIFEDDSDFAHTLEHSLIAVLDFMSPTDEAGIGATVIDGVAKVQPEDPFKVAHRYKVFIAPPPSMGITEAKRISYQALEIMTHSSELLNLKEIAETIQKTA